MHRKRVTLVFTCNCCNLELCLTQLLRNTGGQPCMMSSWSIWIQIAWIAWDCLLSTAWTACNFASKRLENAGSHKKAAVGAGKLMHGLHEFRNWRVPRSNLRNPCFNRLFLNCLNILLEDVMWLALISKLTDEPRPGTSWECKHVLSIRNTCVKIPMWWCCKSYCIFYHINYDCNHIS